MFDNKIGKFIQVLRKELGLTQEELGSKLYVTGKAVSKWERGLSLPDVAIIDKLAKTLGVETSELLNGERGSGQTPITDAQIEEIKRQLEDGHKKRIKKMLVAFDLTLLIASFFIFRSVYLGYGTFTVHYPHDDKNIVLGVPKLSFMPKENDRSFSFKNLRSPNILENEMKKYLSTLNYSTCNDTVYYYDALQDFSIIEYKVQSHFIYSTISYEISPGDYCFTNKMSEYSAKLGGLYKYHTLNGEGFTLSPTANFKPRLVVAFRDNVDASAHEFTAELEIRYLSPIKDRWDQISREEIENSRGTYEIKDNKLYYYRKEITYTSHSVDIPEVSTFEITSDKLILVDNYLAKYAGEIILERQ